MSSPTAFQIVSDLHLETYPSYKSFTLKQTAPNLALLGDIGLVADDALFTFLEKQLTRYWNVFYLPGNHEPIETSWPQAKARLRAFASRMEALRVKSTIGRFILLDQTRFDINDSLTVLGCTLFSDILPEHSLEISSRFIDFKPGKIQNWSVDDHILAHTSDLGWLNLQVEKISREEPSRQVVVLTHHSPTLDGRTVDERHRGSAVSSGFATDLSLEECWMSRNVVLWGFGHTHFSCDFVVDRNGEAVPGMRVVANQSGYFDISGLNSGGMGFEMGKVFLVGC